MGAVRHSVKSDLIKTSCAGAFSTCLALSTERRISKNSGSNAGPMGFSGQFLSAQVNVFNYSGRCIPDPVGPFMNFEQIKDEIRKLNGFDRIGLYRWINDEVAGRPTIGADRSLQIREEMERICKLPFQRRISPRKSAFTGPAIGNRRSGKSQNLTGD
jgi:hypothetical protein